MVEFMTVSVLAAVLFNMPPPKVAKLPVIVELVRREHVSIEDGKTRTTIEQKAQLAAETKFEPGKPQSYKFQMPVSTRGCPSVVSTNGEVTWLLRGILDRPGGKDVVVQQEVYFFNGPHRA